MTPPERSIAGRIDHTLLKPDAGAAEVQRLCIEARGFGFASVCVLPRYVAVAASCLQGALPKVGTVVGFPLGGSHPRTKVLEARQAVADGAQELDMVLPLGEIMHGLLDNAVEDIRGVVEGAGPKVVIKVILETGMLNAEQKALAVQAALAGGAQYVKTSTGMLAGGATVDDVKLLKRLVGDGAKVKASGGIRTLAQARELVAAGADRLGTSAGVSIMGEEAEEGRGA